MKKYLSNREWLNLFVIGFLATMSILPSVYYLIYDDVPKIWFHERGFYEIIGASACFIAGLFSLVSFRVLWNRKQHLGSLWMLLFAVVCLFVAGEEISWGQHFFYYDLPDSVIAANFQKEFNLHNSRLIQSDNNVLTNISIRLVTVYFIGLPMFFVVFPTVESWIRGWGGVGFPIPSMLSAIISLLALTANWLNRKVIYGTVTGAVVKERYGGLIEVWESLLEICLLILAVECFYAVKRKGLKELT